MKEQLLKARLRKRIAQALIAAVSITMIVCFVPQTGMYVYAEDENPAGIQLVPNGVADNISGRQASSVWFGNYKQSSNENGGYNVDPIKWRVLENSKTNHKLFLLSDKNLDYRRYNQTSSAITWQASSIRTWLNGRSAGNFIVNAFAEKEQKAIATTTVAHEGNSEYAIPGEAETEDQIFLLSIEEVMDSNYGFTQNKYKTSTREAKNTDYLMDYLLSISDNPDIVDDTGYWWLRSPGSRTYYAAYVTPFGDVNTYGLSVAWETDDMMVRPALQLDLKSVLFTSAATGGKELGGEGLAEVGENTSGEWKLTLLDNSGNDAAEGGHGDFYVGDEVTINHFANTVTVPYFYASTGENEYISAIITDKPVTEKSAKIKYYGRIAKASPGDVAEVTINIANLAAGDKLYVFNEEYNGPGKTDYASELNEINLPAATIKNEPTANKRIYDGTEQPLLNNGGEANGGTMQYAVGESSTTAPTSGWSVNIPKKTNIGTYYVWYKAKGDAGHLDSAARCLPSRICFPVTFKVKGGAWSDETGGTADRTVPLERYDDQDLALILEEGDIPAVGDDPASGYKKEGFWDEDPAAYVDKMTITEAKTFTYTYEKKTAPEITTAPKASAITYGQTLKDSKLTGGVAKDGDTVVPGTFKWDNTDTAPAVSDSKKTEYDVTFTPTDKEFYETAKTTVTVTVNKADLTITANDQTFTYNGQKQGPGGKTYNNAAEIAEVVKVKGLQGTDALTSVAVGGQGQDVGEYKLIPSAAKVNKNGVGTGNYKISYVNGTLTIEKPKPKITTAPKASAITYGQTLKDSSLTGGVVKAGETVVPGTFKWTKPDTAPAVSDSNRTKYDVTFTPSDATYGTLATKVTLTVNKADIYPTVSIDGWVYGSAANAPAVEGNPGGGDVTFLYKGVDDPDSKFSKKVPTDAGTYVVKAEVAETANYNAGEAMLEFTISPADMQVTSAGYNGLYDGGAHSITVNAPDGAGIEYSKDGGKTYSAENPAYTDAGEYEVLFRVRLENYNEYTGTEYVLIDQAPNQVTVAITGWTYGEPANIPTVTADFGADKAKLAYSDKADGTYKAGCPDQAGTWYVKATVPGTKNYAEGVSEPVAFEIAKAAVTITAEDKSSKRGESLAKLTYKISGGYVEGDDLGIRLSTDADKNEPGDYAIKVSWNKNPNYDATLENGVYTVTGTKIDPDEAKIELDAGIRGTVSGGKLTAQWGSVDGADSYDVYFTYCSRDQFQKVTVSGDTTSLDITKIAGKKLNKKRNYKYYVVAYTTVGGEQVQLARSIKAHVAGTKNKKRTNVKAIKVKKTSYTLKVGKKAKIKAKLVLQKKHKKILTHEKKFRYATSDPAVATVSKGKIKAVGPGTCDIYVYAINGCAKKLTVTVQ